MNEATVEAQTTESQEAAEVEAVKEASEPAADEKKPDEKKEVQEPNEAEKIKFAMQKRIDKMTAKLAERERQLQEIEAKYRVDTPQQSNAPKEDDFESMEDFLKAQGRWEAEQEFKAKTAQAQKAERDAAYSKMIAERQAIAEEKEAELKAVTPDYDEKIAEVQTAIGLLSDKQKETTEFQVFRDMLFSSDNMPALTYELGKNPEIMEEMLTMNPLQIARKIARMEIELEGAPKKQAKPVSAPPTPIGNSSAKANIDPDKMSIEEWTKWRQNQLNKR